MDRLVQEVAESNSEEKNVICCIEEMSELTKVLTKKLRNDHKYSREKLVEEIGHVMLMCFAVAETNGITKEEIQDSWLDAIYRMREGR
jgi:predicted house-cleaning noncanonical NTP pyrophosphatase (MazG superfamily)